MEIDTTEEKFIGNVLKDGAICETCAPTMIPADDGSYYGASTIATSFQKIIKPTLPYAEAVEKGKKLLGLPRTATQVHEAEKKFIADMDDTIISGLLNYSTGHVYMGNDGYWYRMNNDGKSEKMGKEWQSK